MRKKYSRKTKKGGAAPASINNNLFDERYTNAIENIRAEYPDIFNMIQNIRNNGVRFEDIPQLDNAIRILRRRIYLSPPNSNQELNELLNRIEEIREEIDIRSERDRTFRDTLIGYGGKYQRKTRRTRRRSRQKSRKNKSRRN
jgi:hypothetical protein